MAIFLVDYENVNFQGLMGMEYLHNQDSLVLFYSNTSKTISQKYINIIKNKKINLRGFKLINPSKNALDFYLAAECGSLNEKENSDIIIVSKDKGYQAVKDFFSLKNPNLKIFRSENITEGILALKENNERYVKVKKDTNIVDLEIEIAKIDEIKKIQEMSIAAFVGTELEKQSEKIVDFLEKNKNESPKKVYTDALHEFGRISGQKVYRTLKEIKMN